MESKMSNRPLTATELKLVKEFNLAPMTTQGRTTLYSGKAINALAEIKTAKSVKADSEYFTSAEFRADVIAELIANGATELQATNRTRDQFRLFNEARELGMM
jgi:hypothetical protein